ncbi:hypothetical protein M422DRAFT_261091 [Sphaerobolus stellatus SS14]|uniref:Uncharacterized protein n=1 Tax=Sphaerobolus stellatus (strain SS14) TaxID=990650 RepID=A0A0C9VG04_SPHS4|nr:hypothetical protein M422DRAFT_261091 [Sphaerobolus stellatus SS14]
MSPSHSAPPFCPHSPANPTPKEKGPHLKVKVAPLLSVSLSLCFSVRTATFQPLKGTYRPRKRSAHYGGLPREAIFEINTMKKAGEFKMDGLA